MGAGSPDFQPRFMVGLAFQMTYEQEIQSRFTSVICEVCRREITLHCEAVKNRHSLRAIIELCGTQVQVACLQCVRKSKKANKRGTRISSAQVLSRAIIASANGDFSKFYDAITLADSEMETLGRDIASLMEELRATNARHGVVSALLGEANALYCAHLESTYAERRKRANYAISSLELRIMIFGRDGNACRKCGKKTKLSVDHIVPVSKGGSNEIENLQTLCSRCNSAKRDSL